MGTRTMSYRIAVRSYCRQCGSQSIQSFNPTTEEVQWFATQPHGMVRGTILVDNHELTCYTRYHDDCRRCRD